MTTFLLNHLDLVAAPITLASIVAVGRKRWWGWATAACAECLWLTYAVRRGIWGLAALAVAYAALYVWNARKWRRETISAKGE